jgi:hypothetical protein
MQTGPSLADILKTLEGLSGPELLEIKKGVDDLIQSKMKGELGRRTGKRGKLRLNASLQIEREKQFFDKEYKAVIVEMSVNGLVFKTGAMVYDQDMLNLGFRLPSTGEMKQISCQAVRVKESLAKAGVEFEVAAKTVDKQAVKAYKEMLLKRTS